MRGLAAGLEVVVLVVVVAGCGNGTASSSTSDEGPTPAPDQLSEWYGEAQQVVWPIDRVYSSNIDEGCNRIVLGV